MCGEILKIIESISIILTSLIAIYGINKWRSEIIFKRKYELAEEVLALFYHVNERFKAICFPGSTSNEGKSRKRDDNETEIETRIQDDAYIVYERYEEEKEPFIRLHALKFRFVAVFGKDYKHEFEEVELIRNAIFNASRQIAFFYLKEKAISQTSEESKERLFVKMQEFEKIKYGEDDNMNNRMDIVIKKIEEVCIKILNKKKCFFSIDKYHIC